MRMTGRDGVARAVYAAVRQANDAQATEFELARELIAARMEPLTAAAQELVKQN